MSDGVWIGMVWGLVGSTLIVLGVLSLVRVVGSLSTVVEPEVESSAAAAAPDPASLALVFVIGALVVGISALGRRE